ncbi:MAG: MMPL family transporter, partial [Gammaproteobacteria bacterium]
LLSLLPSVREDPLLAAAVARNSDTFVHGLIIAVEGPTAQTTATAAQAARHALATAGYQLENPGSSTDALYDLYRRHRFRLLTPQDTAALAAAPQRSFVTDLQVGLASPGSPGGSLADPGGFFTRYLASLPRPFPALMPENGLLAVPDATRPAYLLTVTLKNDAFGEAGETRASDAVALARKSVAAHCPQCTVTATGPALFSAAERSEGKREVTWLSAGSIIIIVLLVLGFFRSLRPLALVVACVGSGIVAGAAVTLLVFVEINLLTMVFGTTLLGISVDYALHYLSDRRLSADGGTLGRIGPGIALALTTTCIAFAFLAATPFPALRQMALFSIAGLVAAFITVCTVFPTLSKRWGRNPASAPMHWVANAVAGGGRRWRAIVTILLVAGAVGGLARLHAVDDLRELQALPPALVAATAKISRLLGTPPTSGFFFVRAPDLSAALARERRLTALAARQAPGLVLVGLAGFLPAPQAQARALAAWMPLMKDDASTLKQALVANGLPADFTTGLAADWHGKDGELTAQQFMHTLPALGRYRVSGEGETGLVVQAYGDAPQSMLVTLAAAAPGVAYVNPLDQLNAAFKRIRWHATLWVAAGYLLTLLLLGWRYGVRGGLAILLSPLTAALVTLGILGWLGAPVNVFVVVALMLVAGVGVDYALFLREGSPHLRSTSFAVALAAATTLASFGLLGASRIPALHVFGLTVAIGILVAWLVAPLTLAAGGRRSS